ncbi:MAG: hypothetical protein ACM3YM_04365 [Sphingomonadales bacterium]
MFRGWEDFYFLIGSSAAGLIGLLFVVVTLTAGTDRRSAQRGASLYMTPVVFHLAAVFVLSAVAIAPGLSYLAIGLISAGGAVAGIAYATFVTLGLRKPDVTPPPHWSDIWFYGVAAGAVYAALLAAAAATLAQAPWAEIARGIVLIALLLLSIRNAWDLVTWLAPGTNDADGLQEGEDANSR